MSRDILCAREPMQTRSNRSHDSPRLPPPARFLFSTYSIAELFTCDAGRFIREFAFCLTLHSESIK
ncbi:unnamed protein product [Mycena citricolor]|uniref:Uncharacterized protein n=1 Tax=Mycena citricolor TaxID=2018698 RepID=A0AAD2HJL8_9AGAR|nr:unnamed protein product [Mycena citricolor]